MALKVKAENEERRKQEDNSIEYQSEEDEDIDPRKITKNQLENRLYSEFVKKEFSESSDSDCIGGMKGYVMSQAHKEE